MTLTSFIDPADFIKCLEFLRLLSMQVVIHESNYESKHHLKKLHLPGKKSIFLCNLRIQYQSLFLMASSVDTSKLFVTTYNYGERQIVKRRKKRKQHKGYK